MTWVSPPETVTAMRDALTGCAAWTFGPSAVHYPTAPANATGTFAVLSVEGRAATWQIYGLAVAIGTLQELVQNLRQQLMSRYRSAGTGLVIASEPDASDVTVSTEPAIAAGDTALTASITADVGIAL